MPRRIVRIVGCDDPYEVIAESSTSLVLVNPSARRRRDITLLERQLADLHTQLAACLLETEPASDDPR